jgi:hypothetical protein
VLCWETNNLYNLESSSLVMTSPTTTQFSNSKIKFSSPLSSEFVADIVEIFWTNNSDTLVKFCIVLQIDFNGNHQAELDKLFNLTPENQVATTKIFQPEFPIRFTLSLRPDILPEVVDHLDSLDDYFSQLSIMQPDHQLLSTDNWFLLAAKQLTPSGEEIGYRTFWSYADPALLFSETPSTDDLADRLLEFFQDWAKHNLPNLTQAVIAETVQELSQELEMEADVLSSMTQEAIAAIFSEMVEGFQRWTQGEAPLDTLSPGQQQPLMPIIQGFFEQDGWEFEQLKDQSMLRLMAQGKTDKWTCYAQANAQRQFLFYSICPIAIPKPKRSKLAEFITRANYGMTIGNFELDYTDGEIRYKTSIDVEGDKLTAALIKRLVYTNVAMMDEYLPGIRAMIEAGLSAEAAIQLSEQKVQDLENSSV